MRIKHYGDKIPLQVIVDKALYWEFKLTGRRHGMNLAKRLRFLVEEDVKREYEANALTDLPPYSG